MIYHNFHLLYIKHCYKRNFLIRYKVKKEYRRMIPPFIIEEIKKWEEQKRKNYEQPVPPLDLPHPEEEGEKRNEEENGGECPEDEYDDDTLVDYSI